MSAGVQPSKRIERFAPELDKIISPSAPIQELADGFGGPLGPAVWGRPRPWRVSGALTRAG